MRIGINLRRKSWVALGLVGVDADVVVWVDNAGGRVGCMWYA